MEGDRFEGDGQSLTFAKIEALVAKRNVAAMDSRVCRGTYDLCLSKGAQKVRK
jgi:hypothetical protein